MYSIPYVMYISCIVYHMSCIYHVYYTICHVYIMYSIPNVMYISCIVYHISCIYHEQSRVYSIERKRKKYSKESEQRKLYICIYRYTQTIIK